MRSDVWVNPTGETQGVCRRIQRSPSREEEKQPWTRENTYTMIEGRRKRLRKEEARVEKRERRAIPNREESWKKKQQLTVEILANGEDFNPLQHGIISF